MKLKTDQVQYWTKIAWKLQIPKSFVRKIIQIKSAVHGDYIHVIL